MTIGGSVQAVEGTARVQPVIQVTVHVGLGIEGIRMIAEPPHKAADRRLELGDEHVGRRGLLWATIWHVALQHSSER